MEILSNNLIENNFNNKNIDSSIEHKLSKTIRSDSLNTTDEI